MTDAATKTDEDIVLIQNRLPRIVGFSSGESKPAVKDKEGNVTAPAKLATPIRLKPGINRVDAKHWNDPGLQQSKLLLGMLEREEIVVLDDKGELKAMAVTRAVAIVTGTLDKPLLRRWAAEETRKPVQEAIAAQLALLDGSKPDPEPNAETPAQIAPSSPLRPPGGGVDVSAPRGGGRKRR